MLKHNPQDATDPRDSNPRSEGEDLEILFDFQHYHLPELEGKGLISYDRAENIVTKGPYFEEVEPLLTLIDEHRGELPDDWL